MRSTVGRPKSLENLSLVTLEQAVQKLKEFYGLPRSPYSKRTLQNKIWRRELNRYGPYHMTMVDWEEIQRKLCR